jgi:hypothetical protein
MARPGALSLLLLMALGGCANGDGQPLAYNPISSYEPAEADPGRATYRAVDRMLEAASARLNPDGIIVVGTVADIRDVDKSSPLGNLIAEYVRTRLVQKGLSVSDLRVRSAVRMQKNDGEMMMSRDVAAVVAPAGASEFVTGTYAVGYTQVHVSLKLISTVQAQIIAGADFNLPRQMEVDALLSAGR